MRITLLLAIAFVLGGCASARTIATSHEISTSELLYGGIFPEVTVTTQRDELLAASPAMKAFVDEHVTRSDSPRERWDALVAAISSPSLLQLTYNESTKSAAEAFAGGYGNCLSFSAMLVSLTRYAGLEASFHEVDVPPDWTDRNGMLVRWGHINVIVDLGAQGERVLDFDTAMDTSGFDGEVVPDARAIAHFFNNLGVEQMQAGDPARAFAYFRRAVEEQEGFTPAWNNLGALYRRAGFLAHAESAYRHSLEVDEQNLTAMNNLVRLYEVQGDEAAAAEFRSRVTRYRETNPYYHYGLARAALGDGDLDAAKRHVRDALRRKRNEPRFHRLLAEILRAQGQPERAERTIRLADSLIAGVQR